MSRLVGGKPIIEVDKEVADHRSADSGSRTGASPAEAAATRDQFSDRLKRLCRDCSRAGRVAPIRSKLLSLTARRDQRFCRYLVTVRRATFKPWRSISSTISSSDIGFCLSSLAMISSSFCLIVSQAISSPSAVVVPPPKNRLRAKIPARCLHPFVVDGPADRRDVDADSIGDLLHLERLDELRAFVEEVPLVLDDRPGDLQQRVPALLDRVDQPAGRLDLLLDVLASRGSGLLVTQHSSDSRARSPVGRMLVDSRTS